MSQILLKKIWGERGILLHAGERLFWIDSTTKKIEYTDLDGNSRTVLVSSSEITYPSALNFYQDKLLILERVAGNLTVLNVTSETNSSVYSAGVVGESTSFTQSADALIFQYGKALIIIIRSVKLFVLMENQSVVHSKGTLHKKIVPFRNMYKKQKVRYSSFPVQCD